MKKKISAIVGGIVSTVVLSTAGLSTNVFATPNKPYDSADVSISSNADSATASITRCSCNPVDNYLMAAIRVQYYDGSNYHWDPEGENTYYFSEGTNVYSESKSISRKNINYAKGWFVAKCGSGSEASFNKEARH